MVLASVEMPGAAAALADAAPVYCFIARSVNVPITVEASYTDA